MDLGVAREMYDATLRKDAEKKREVEFQKQQAEVRTVCMVKYIGGINHVP